MPVKAWLYHERTCKRTELDLSDLIDSQSYALEETVHTGLELITDMLLRRASWRLYHGIAQDISLTESNLSFMLLVAHNGETIFSIVILHMSLVLRDLIDFLPETTHNTTQPDFFPQARYHPVPVRINNLSYP